MKPDLLALLRCPRCGGELRFQPLDATGSEGLLSCACGARHPVVSGVPRFVTGALAPHPEWRDRFRDRLPNEFDTQAREVRAQEKTRRAFEYEWRYFGDADRIYGGTPEASMELLFEEFAQPELTVDWVRGKRVLDAGCGPGRYVKGLAALGAEAHGIDFGLGIDVARAHTAGLDNVALVQGSVLEPPFAKQSFDLVFTKGVVHCTPNPSGAVRQLSGLVKPGGYLFVWVYPRYPSWFLVPQEIVRAVTKRLPPALLIPLSFAAAPLVGSVLRRGVGVPTHAASPRRGLGKTSRRERAQMVYDWLAPWYQSYHTAEEVAEWLEANGFQSISSCPIPSGAAGQKSLSAPSEA